MNKNYFFYTTKLYCIFISMLLISMLSLSETFAQMYVTADPPEFYYYDIAANTFTRKADTPLNFGSQGNLVFDGTNIFALRGLVSNVPTNNFYKYIVATNTWASMTNIPTPVGSGASMIHVGGFIYTTVGDDKNLLLKYNIASNSWSSLSNTPGVIGVGGFLTWDGGDYIYCSQGGLSNLGFYRYSIAGNSWTSLASLPITGRDGGSIKLVDNYIYYVRGGGSNTQLYRYDIANNSWISTLAVLPQAVNDGGSLVHYNGALYTPRGDGTTDFYTYNIAGNTWSTVGPFPSPLGNGGYLLGAMSLCAPPVATVDAIQATCTSGTANVDAKLQLTTFDANAKKIDYSVGSTYTGLGFASATTVSGVAPFPIVSTLISPTALQPYTIRVFCDATTYTDYLTVLQPKQCLTSDLSVSISPAIQSGNAGEYRTYTIIINNAGPDSAPDVQVKVPIPPNGTYLTATPQQGTYDSNTKLWTVGTIPVGNVTMTFTVKVN